MSKGKNIIESGKIKLNNIGKIARNFWLEIPNHFSNIKLDEFIIMPNHMYGIVIIEDDCNKNKVETLQCKSKIGNFHSKISPKSKSLSTIIRSHKSICKKTINKTQNKLFFAWQRGFYYHIIRDEKSLKTFENILLITH